MRCRLQYRLKVSEHVLTHNHLRTDSRGLARERTPLHNLGPLLLLTARLPKNNPTRF